MSEHLLSERLAVVSVIDPDNRASSTTLGDAIDMAYHRKVIFIVATGVMQSTRTVDFVLTESATSGGTYTQISGKSITQLTGVDDNKQAIINLSAEEMGEGMRYVKMSLRVGGVTGTAANDTFAIALAGRTRFSDAVTTTSYGDLASVDEIVA